MNLKIRLLIAACMCFALSQQPLQAQYTNFANYVFAADSLKGFDQAAASAGALANNCFGIEYKVFMYRAQRNYINQKYNIRLKPSPTTLYQNPVFRPLPVPSGACNNEDFELGTTQGWTLSSGTSNNSCASPNLTGASLYTVVSGPVSDSRVSGQINSYFDASSITSPSGSYFIRLNDDQAGAKAVRLSKAFIPTASSALFQYAYIAVIEDGAHNCCDQPGFNIKVTITNTATNASTLLACPQISVAVPGALCNFTVPSGGPSFSPCIGAQGAGWSYCNWTASAIDLTPFINFLVRIDVTVVDCAFGGHGAYAYFDARCAPMTVTGNNNSFPAGTPSITVPTCGAAGATVCAPPGLGPYWWAGPGVSAPYNSPGMGNQCFTSSLSATYTLYMDPPGSCTPITRVITTTITPAPLLLISTQQASCGGTIAIITATPSGSAQNPSQMDWSPNPLSLNSATTIGTYTLPPGPLGQTVSVTATDPLGCKITQIATVNPAPPTPTFQLVNVSNSPSITCITPTVVLNAVSNYTYGTISFFWSAASATASGASMTVLSALTVTCYGSDLQTGCQFTQTAAVGVNTIAPSTTVTPLFQNVTCNLSSITTVTAISSPSVNVIQTIYSPAGTSVSANSYSLIYVPTPNIYTYCAVDMVNGCSTCKNFTVTSNQGFPTFSVVSSQTLGCSTKSCTSISIVNAATSPVGGAVSYTLLTPGNAGITPSGTLSGISVYNVCSPGNYTVVTKDNISLCETRVPLSILLNNFGPNLQVDLPRTILDCTNPDALFKASSSTGNVTYEWRYKATPGNQSSDTIRVQANTAAPNNTVANSYTLVITDEGNKCVTSTVIPVYQSLFVPQAIISGTLPITCTTPTVNLTNQSISRVPVNSIFWQGGAVTTQTWVGPTPQDPSILKSTYIAYTPGVYTLSVIDKNNGCVATATANVPDAVRYPLLNNPIAPPVSVLDCGDDTTRIAPIISTPSAGLVYSWNSPPDAAVSGQNTRVLVTNKVGEYKVNVLDPSNGCRSSVLMRVVPGTLTASFEASAEQGYVPFSVHLDNTSHSSKNNPKFNSFWTFGNGQTFTSSIVSPTDVTFKQPGAYTVKLWIQKGGCIKEVSRIIMVDLPGKLESPNIFTPNGDGVNDVYFLHATNLDQIDFTIVDRWGNEVFKVHSTTGNIVWDGKNQAGQDMSDGVYFYKVQALGKDGQKFDQTGTITLIR